MRLRWQLRRAHRRYARRRGTAASRSSWPRLAASCRAGDWQAAASNCEIKSAGNPGVVPRNLCQRALFELAAGVSVEDALAGIPAGYTGDAARRALEGLVVSTWALDGSEPTLDGTGGG